MKNTVIMVKKHYQIIMAALLIAGVLTSVACNEISKYQQQKKYQAIEKIR